MSRIRLSGFGEPIPVPDDIPEASSDSIGNIPRVSYNLADGTIFRPADYLALYYTHYEVTVIGAKGGNSKPLRGTESALPSIVYGGAGGGGGLHVVRGRLIDLPAVVPVVVGQPGAEGLPGEDAGDGGASLFGMVALASGGKGGKGAPPFQKLRFRTSQGGTVYDHFTGGGDGGDGGVGGRSLPGGGAHGAHFIHPVPPTVPNGLGTSYRSFESEDGTWDGEIGQGGGGGMGGVWPPAIGSGFYYNYGYGQGPYPVHPGTRGGRGSFNRSDTSHFMDGQSGSTAGPNGYIIPGAGGGATINRRTLGSNYGGIETRSLEQSHPEGVVVIRLRRKQ